jgi:putative transcriptional regulator
VTRSRSSAPHERGGGLSSFRRAGRVTEVLFLYEITTRRQARLRTIAESMGVTVQATSQLYRELSKRGWVEQVEGVYRPTVRGVEALHAALTELRGDLERRLDHLRIVHRTRAIADRDLGKDEAVELSMRDGLLHASPARRGHSSGLTTHEVKRGGLVEVSDLRGIVPLTPAPVRCLVLPHDLARDLSGRKRQLVEELRLGRYRLLISDGLEAHHLLASVTREPVIRFGAAAVARDASQMGVPVVIVVTSERLPSLLQGLSEPPGTVPVSVRTLEGR